MFILDVIKFRTFLIRYRTSSVCKIYFPEVNYIREFIFDFYTEKLL